MSGRTSICLGHLNIHLNCFETGIARRCQIGPEVAHVECLCVKPSRFLRGSLLALDERVDGIGRVESRRKTVRLLEDPLRN